MFYKYPRTYHLPYSETIVGDDKRLDDDKLFENKEVVITIKMDGENTSIYKDYCHARSLDSKHEDYHSWLLNYCYNFNYMLKENERICGEYLYAQHSIHYKNLDSYFLAFSVWENDICLNWQKTKKRCEELNILMVPEIYTGVYDKKIIINLAKKVINEGNEGIVIRNINSFNIDDFSLNVAKYVRPNHVQTDIHWKNSLIIKNDLK